ncbi:GNAT family N-acetyltransferase [Citricoccus sp. NR2]|uniref:GNAT family N-acetyltransferase n=1 Tax=Citricoccus sp. NR2 TaxID=3004095 RepID=UPI0022DD9F0A|nr:GNAT family N-acetyltransferase [Citricoccus sp. NR2]WBL18376.1 GNAT family N-acetyltransferase [Citricoccus sp. NR2]
MSNFDHAGDVALVAEDCGKLVGAALSRLCPDEEPAYGTIDAATPNLALAVAPEHRRNGLGTALLEGLFRKLTEARYSRVSLSVDTTNRHNDSKNTWDLLPIMSRSQNG